MLEFIIKVFVFLGKWIILFPISFCFYCLVSIWLLDLHLFVNENIIICALIIMVWVALIILSHHIFKALVIISNQISEVHLKIIEIEEKMENVAYVISDRFDDIDNTINEINSTVDKIDFVHEISERYDEISKDIDMLRLRDERYNK